MRVRGVARVTREVRSPALGKWDDHADAVSGWNAPAGSVAV